MRNSNHRATCALALGLVFAPFMCDCFEVVHHPLDHPVSVAYIVAPFAYHADEPVRAPGTSLLPEPTVAMASSMVPRP
jgi:hypothetical protein